MRAKRRALYWRRRLLAAVSVVGLAAGLWALGSWAAHSHLTAPEPRSLVNVTQRSYVVQPGDTLWTIARQVQPRGDVRPIVDRLADARGGTRLRPGELIVLP